MKNSKENKLLFCFAVYVLIFIAMALLPSNRNIFFERINILESLYKSNLIIPFIANTILMIYYVFKK